MKACFIINPNSGPKSFENEFHHITETLSNKGNDVALFTTKKSGDAKIIAERAVNDGFNIVIAVGGDGTINEVANGLANSKSAMGVIPTGTANVFASEVGIPSWHPLERDSILKAAEKILNGHEKIIDLGKITFSDKSSRYFLMWCGIGLDAAITAEKKSPRKFRFGRIINYLKWTYKGLIIAFKYKGAEAKIEIEDNLVEDHILMVLANNGKKYAKFFSLATDAKLDDGLLDVVIFKNKGILYNLQSALCIIFKCQNKSKNLETIKTKHFSINSVAPMPIHVDAETVGTTPAVIEIAPKALKIIL